MASFEEDHIEQIGFVVTRLTRTTSPVIVGATGTTVDKDGNPVRAVSITNVALSATDQANLVSLAASLEALLKVSAGLE